MTDTTFSIYRALVGSRVRAQAQYRVSFVLDVFGSALATVLDFVEVLVIFHNVPTLRGWSLAQLALLYGTAGVSLALTDTVIGHLDRVHEHIRSGTFDQFLVRPLGSLFQVIASDFELRNIGRLAQTLTVLVIACVVNHVHWTVGRIVMLPVMIVAGCGIFAAIWIAGAATTFWTVNTMEITNSFTYGGGLVAQYPLNLFGGWFRRLVFVIPLAFVNYFPVVYLLGRDDPLHLPSILRVADVPIAIVSLVLARAVWQTGVRQYRGTGS